MNRCCLKLLGTLLAICSPFCLLPTGNAENQTLKYACEAKARKASQLIQTLGNEAAFKQIGDPKGAFVSETSHVFCIDAGSGYLLAHKVVRFVGSNMHYYLDSEGNHPFTSILERARQTKSGWIQYMTYGSGPERRKTPALKKMYFLKVPGKNIVLCCGYWEDT